MATPPESTKSSLQQRLTAHARDRWPQISRLQIRHRAGFAYVDAELVDGTVEKLVRLRYTGICERLGVRDLPAQQRRLRGLVPALLR